MREKARSRGLRACGVEDAFGRNTSKRAPGKETTREGHVLGVICVHGTWIS